MWGPSCAYRVGTVKRGRTCNRWHVGDGLEEAPSHFQIQCEAYKCLGHQKGGHVCLSVSTAARQCWRWHDCCDSLATRPWSMVRAERVVVDSRADQFVCPHGTMCVDQWLCPGWHPHQGKMPACFFEVCSYGSFCKLRKDNTCFRWHLADGEAQMPKPLRWKEVCSKANKCGTRGKLDILDRRRNCFLKHEADVGVLADPDLSKIAREALCNGEYPRSHEAALRLKPPSQVCSLLYSN
jgi:hypothetical protein